MNIKNNSDKSNEGFLLKLIVIMLVIVLITGIIAMSSSMKKDNADDEASNSTPTYQNDTQPPPHEINDTSADTFADTSDTANSQTEPVSQTEPDSQTAPDSEKDNLSSITTSSEDYSHIILGETEDKGQNYIDKIIFFGDSTTLGLKTYKMLTDGRDTKQVWTPVSGTLTLDKATIAKIYYPDTGEEILVKDALTAKKPEILIITLGVNGISYMNEESFKLYYNKLIDEVKAASPDTKIILQSIFPVSTLWTLTTSFDNAKIDTANTWVLDIAKDRGLKYLDTNPSLKDETGYLPLSYQNDGDGMHLNSIGFTAVLDYIRTHAYSD